MQPTQSLPTTLAGWILRCGSAPPLPAHQANLEQASARSGTRLYAHLPQAPVWVPDWYDGFLNDPRVNHCSLPLVAPYLLDLMGLLTPRPRYQLPEGFPDCQLARDYRCFYLRGHLEALGNHHVVGRLRDRLHGCRDGAVLRPILLRFVELIFHRMAEAWQTEDAISGNASLAWDGRLRSLHDPREQMAFLVQIGQISERQRVVERHAEVAERLFPLHQRFLLASARHRADVLESDSLRRDLFRVCIRGQSLPEVDRLVDPMRQRDGLPLCPEQRGGEQVEIRQVTRSTSLERFADVLPQELALLRREEGLRLLLHKQSREGLLIWERQAHTEPIRRHRLLLCFLASGEGAHEAPDDESSFSGTAQALQVVFNTLRDLALHATEPTLILRVVLYLVRQRRRRPSQVWEFTLEDLRERLGGSRMDDMLAVEGLAPGYFFRAQRARRSRRAIQSPVAYLRDRCAEFDPDLTVTTYLAPAEQLGHLPEFTPPMQHRPGVVHRTWGVRLVGQAGQVDMARDRLSGPFTAVPEETFRTALLDDLLGRVKGQPGWGSRKPS